MPNNLNKSLHMLFRAKMAKFREFPDDCFRIFKCLGMQVQIFIFIAHKLQVYNRQL